MATKTAQRWFEVTRLADGLTLIIEPHADPLIRCNIWHIRGRDRDLLIDTGLGISPLTPLISELADREPWAVATHAHFDHIGGMHEFHTRMIHREEARGLAEPDYASIRVDDFPPEFRLLLEDAHPGGELIAAYPSPDFDSTSFRVRPATATRILDDGDFIDLGDRAFEVMHLPGHSRGSIGLWDASTGTLFAGDAIYDGELLADLPGSDTASYVTTMKRLRSLPVTIVHGGHCDSFGRDKMLQIIDEFLAR